MMMLMLLIGTVAILALTTRNACHMYIVVLTRILIPNVPYGRKFSCAQIVCYRYANV